MLKIMGIEKLENTSFFYTIIFMSFLPKIHNSVCKRPLDKCPHQKWSARRALSDAGYQSQKKLHFLSMFHRLFFDFDSSVTSYDASLYEVIAHCIVSLGNSLHVAWATICYNVVSGTNAFWVMQMFVAAVLGPFDSFAACCATTHAARLGVPILQSTYRI